jgi:hypothetical protein
VDALEDRRPAAVVDPSVFDSPALRATNLRAAG